MNRARGTINRSPRVDLRRPAVLIDSDGVPADVTILDVSSGGFRLEVAEPPRIGELVKLKVERGAEYSGQIRWALGNEAGGVFLESVADAQWTGMTRSPPMTDQDENRGDERRQGGERREDERRQDDARQQGGRSDDRRKEERRGGERRCN